MKKTLITLLGIVLCGAAVAVEKPAGATMEQYVDALMRRMTLEEKIGQLNLPSAGDITTGQAKSSDIAEKIRRGEVGGLFNICLLYTSPPSRLRRRADRYWPRRSPRRAPP